MPGISLICDFTKDLRQDKKLYLNAFNSLLHFDRYSLTILQQSKFMVLGCTRYQEYPIATYEDDKHFICIEGKIYNIKSNLLENELRELSDELFSPSENTNDKLINWLLNTDGDFVIYLYNKKTRTILIINDLLGRLPLYYYSDNEIALVSRELQFITCLMNDIVFDKMAIAQTLLINNPIGKRTLFKNIYRLKPASIININHKIARIEINNIYQFNFDKKQYSDKTIEDNANQLASIFSEACKNRISTLSDYKFILSLSGGLDSRAVGAGLKKNRTQFHGATMQYPAYCPEIEGIIAESLSKVLDIDWKLFKLAHPKGKDFLKLIRIKNGTNSLSMSFILPFFEQLIKTYGSQSVYFTGDTGEIMKGIKTSAKIDNIDDLINYLLCDDYALLPFNDVVEMVGVNKDEIFEDMKYQIEKYPEFNAVQKFVHFIIYERSMNWNHEAMDRNRFYFWMAAPLKSNQFIQYAMNCPDNQKNNFDLYRRFLLKLSPQVASVNYSDYSSSITSINFKFRLLLQSIYSTLPINIKKIIRRLKHANLYNANNISSLEECLFNQLNNCNAINTYLLESVIMNKSKQFRKHQTKALFTITSLIEHYLCRSSSIEDYYYSDLT